MTEIVKGLFGFTPQELATQRDQRDQASAMAQAKLSNTEFANYALSRGAGQLARAVGGMMGAEDPEMKKASDLQGILKTGDFNTVEGATAMAKQAAAMGYGNEAQQMYAHALELEKTQAEIGAKKATALKDSRAPDTSTTEMKNAAALAASQGAVPGTPEWVKAYQTQLARLTAKDVTVQKAGIAERTREPVYRDKDGQFVYRKDADGTQVRVPYSGGVDQTTSKTNIDARNIGPNAFQEKLGKLDAEAVDEAMKTRKAAIDQLTTLQKMVDIESRPVISGTLAEQRTDVSNFLNTLGLSSNADRIKTANSQEYIKYTTGLVLDSLKKTGYNPSNVDMTVVQSSIPRLGTDPAARREITKFFIDVANKSIKEADNLETYARKNSGLSGYKPAVPEVSFKGAAPASAYAGMSDAELAARIKAAQAKTK
jgi:hypothetical protein